MTDDAGPGFELMGVVNVTPDSFSDGGRYLEASAAIGHGLELAGEGASILDVGGESTRPGAEPVAVAEELRRVMPVIEGLLEGLGASGGAGGGAGPGASGNHARISIDTCKAQVAAAALQAGAAIVNDVTALRAAPEIAELVAEHRAQLCLMHMLGTPQTMQQNPRYDDVVADVKRFLEERLRFATDHGVAEERILLDPGIGFGKTTAHNLELLRRLPELVAIGPPILIGTSRKGFLGRLTGRSDPSERLAATVATNVLAYERGARVFRVHDVAPVIDALTVTAATVTGATVAPPGAPPDTVAP